MNSFVNGMQPNNHWKNEQNDSTERGKNPAPNEAVSDSADFLRRGVVRWALFAGNPRPVSFFKRPRFPHFSSGRHEIDHFPVDFKKLYPRPNLGDKFFTTDGAPESVFVPGLLAMLVPETSPHFTTLKRGVAEQTVSLANIWHATRHPLSIMLVVGDEYCIDGLFARELSQWSRPTLRTYFTAKAQVVVNGSGDFNFSTRSSLKHRQIKKSIYVPLGPRFEFIPVGEAERKSWPSTQRPRLFNLLVSLSTNALRTKIAKLASTIQFDALAKLNSETSTSYDSNHSQKNANGTETLLPGAETALLHNPKRWQAELPGCQFSFKTSNASDGCRSSSDSRGGLLNFDGLYEGQYLPAEAYRQALLESVFTICPPGHSPETFRLYEAIEAGSIPIVDGAGASIHERWGSGSGQVSSPTEGTNHRRLKTTGQCIDPMRPFRDSGAPFLWVSDWEGELEQLLRKLRQNPQKVEAHQKALAVWYDGFMKNSTMLVEKAFDTHLALDNQTREESK